MYFIAMAFFLKYLKEDMVANIFHLNPFKKGGFLITTETLTLNHQNKAFCFLLGIQSKHWRI